MTKKTPLREKDYEEWVRRAADDMRISKRARDYWRAELEWLEHLATQRRRCCRV